jgi:hypothetical protein
VCKGPEALSWLEEQEGDQCYSSDAKKGKIVDKELTMTNAVLVIKEVSFSTE